MGTKNRQSTNDLETLAATYAERKQEEATARAIWDEKRGSHWCATSARDAGAEWFAIADAEVDRLRAEEALHEAGIPYGRALLARAVADGDELAIAADAASVRADMVAALAEAEEHERLAKAARERIRPRIDRAQEAREQLAAAWQEAGLPPPPDVPGYRNGVDLLKLFRDAAEGSLPQERYDSGAADLEREVRKARARLEREAREREARKEERRLAIEQREQEERARIDAQRAATAKLQAEYAAEQEERKALADAHRERERRESGRA